MHLGPGIVQGNSFLADETVLVLAGINLAQETVPNAEATRVYAAEDELERSSPTRALSMSEAAQWITTIAENEDLDPPVLMRQKMSSDLLGLAFTDEWCIAVRKLKPTQLLLLHELAHLSCANKGHGPEFQRQLVEYVRKYVSVTHAAELAQLLK